MTAPNTDLTLLHLDQLSAEQRIMIVNQFAPTTTVRSFFQYALQNAEYFVHIFSDKEVVDVAAELAHSELSYPSKSFFGKTGLVAVYICNQHGVYQGAIMLKPGELVETPWGEKRRMNTTYYPPVSSRFEDYVTLIKRTVGWAGKQFVTYVCTIPNLEKATIEFNNGYNVEENRATVYHPPARNTKS